MQLPNLPRGSIIPQPNLVTNAEKIINENKAKEQRKHDYKVALYGAVCGGIIGLITSLSFWLITK